jgi:PAS domain S-box-containing protein
MKILLVDDNDAQRELLRIRLQAEGHATCEAADGVEALAQLERQPVDAVVSDVLVPRMDGFHLCHTLRKHERFGDLPFLFCSGAYTGESDAKLALDLGADQHLAKPCPMTTLLQSIRQATGQKQIPGPVEANPPVSQESENETGHSCPFGGALVAKLDANQQRDAQAQEQLRQTERRVRQSAIRMIVTLAVSIFLAECTAMFALRHFPALPYWLATVLDAIWIELLVAPLLFFFVFRPLVRALVQREQAEVALRQANEDLEFRVQERTARLEIANTRLQKEIAERKQAEQVARANGERFKLLADVSARLLSAGNPQTIIEDLCSAVMLHLSCDCFLNYLIEPAPSSAGNGASRRLHLNVCAGISSEQARQIEWLDTGAAICGLAAHDNAPVVIEHIQDHDDPRAAMAKTLSVQAFCSYPLQVQGRVIGTLSFGSRKRPSFTPEELAVAKSVSSQVAVAVQRLHDLEALRHGERTWRQLAEAMTNLVWTCTAGGACDFLSKQWLEYTGRTETEQLRDGWLDQIHPNDLALVRAAWQHALQTGGELDLECRIRRHDGVYRWFKVRAVPVRDAQDQIFKWYGSSTDIHDLRETEAALRESEERRKAEQQVRELNEQLAQRVKDLAAANDELEAFSYSVSHDLRAPLRQATGFVDILRGTSSDQLSPRIAEYLGLIRDAMKRMGVLIEDLLAFSRVGRVELRWNEINLADLVTEVRQTLEPPAEERTVVWKIGNLPHVRGDASMLRQVLTNLLENALKFTRTRPQAELEIGCTTEPTEYVFSVRDNGVGFNPEYAGRLFGVFQRLHRAAEFEGTGIGLANVRRIVHRHGGRTWAESVEGQGATFYFSLPRR